MKIIKLSVLVAAIFSSFSIQAQDPSQSVFVSGTPKGILGSPVSITIGYDVTDADATLTGLGLRVHYNSSALEFVEFANVLTTDNISSDGPSDDVDDQDGDASTDKFITANWASLFGSWPGSLPSDLLTATFNVADDDSLESTVVNFSAASNAAGYLFAPNSYTLDIIGGSWDFDGNGSVDALTDGLLMLRHSFNLRGDALVSGVIATDSTLTNEQVEANVAAAYQIADIDDNGVVDALTDGLMLLRYMFNLRGDALVDQTVAQDAARTLRADIEQYIVSFMPSADDAGDTGSGDTGSGDTGSGDTGSDDTGSGDTGSGDTGSGDTGSGDTGSGDTGSGDTGSGDTGSGDTGSATGTEKGPAEFTEAFGGTTIDGELFTFPAAAEGWAGFANMDLDLYPFTFSAGGSITFTAAVPSGGSVGVKFRFEKNPHPDVDPSYDTSTVTISGATESSYSVDIPSQGSNTFRSLIMYVVDRNKAVQVSNLMVTELSGSDAGDSGSGDTGSGDTGSGDTGSGDTGSGDTGSGNDDLVTETVGPANFIEAFGGTTMQGDEFTHPSSAEPWAGIANMDLSLYPFNFTDGGSISFTGAVPSGGSVNVQFKFEFNSHPDTEPSYSTAFTTISGSADQTYMIQIPSQGIKTFSNLIFYIQERNTAVKIADLMVTTTTDPNVSSGGNGVDTPDDYNTLGYGAGSIGDAIYPSNHRCKSDYGYWIENAGVISTDAAVQALGCNQGTGIPTGNITKLYPQLTGPAANKPTQTHKWWGSTSFLGEMTLDDPYDASYITPDPMIARVHNKGVRVASIPGGLNVVGADIFQYQIPDPFSEVFEGIAIGNTAHSNLDAYTKDHSSGSVTVMWKSGTTEVMEATFVHGSPYIYFKAYSGDFVIRTLRENSGEKGIFYNQGNTLGVWTNVAGVANNFLIVGEGATSFSNTNGNQIGVNNTAKELTLVYLPEHSAGSVSSSMINLFESKARNKVASLDIDYQVDRNTNKVTVSHQYLDNQGALVDTIAGLHPLHWKNTSQALTNYKTRSARGTIKFAELSQFSYQIPYVGVLPTMPSIDGSFDQQTLEGLVTEFVNQGSNVWNYSSQGGENTDTYWSGKSYGKVAEVAAIAQSLDMQSEANQLITWLKAELSDWFSSEADGALKTKKYFVYDSDWNTLLGFDEAYGSHQRLADHHFHYGYFVRAAAEICRVDLAWCGQDQYGPMIELLIRDYAADKDDPMFPHMRNFDPANGFSWADGQVNFARGNNNESTSEAATAYGAIILYGLATGNNDLIEKGMYLHASTGATYWEYWNNIDGYNNVSSDADNFPSGYNRITTSIIWGDGASFSTWFSGAYAHILGIQGLPSSPLIFHVGLHAGYMEDYVDLGLSESSNGKPSGLVDDQWRDLWWNLWAMTDAQAAIADYNSVSSYVPEQGESKAHTYHWIHTFDELGHLATGTGEITANHPAAIAFDKNGTKSYVVYNFTDQTIPVTFREGNTVIHTMNATPFGFTVE